MRSRVRDSEPSLRGEIEYLLSNRAPDFDRGEQVGTAWTAKAIAEELGAELDEVKAELRSLREEGVVTIRQLRSGHVLWKLTDIHHDKWQAFAGPGAALGSRVALQRF
jgi:biotin operon repressor